jgi:hypothetical protein
LKTDWELVKTTFQTTDKKLAELAADFKLNYDVVKRHAAKGKWTEARKLWRSKTQQMAAEQRSTEMATDIVQFDQDCLGAARKGIELVNRELNFALGNEKPKLEGDIKHVTAYIEACIDAATKFGKALVDYQKAGKLAFGENPDVDKDITIKVKYDKE